MQYVTKNFIDYECTNESSITAIELDNTPRFSGLLDQAGNKLFKTDTKFPIGYGHKYD